MTPSTEDDNIDVLIKKIEIARDWAQKHFNSENATDPRLIDDDFELVKPSAFVDFPLPDRMEVQPAIMGHRSKITFVYKLAFVGDEGLRWKFQSLLLGGHPMPHNLYRHYPDLEVM